MRTPEQQKKLHQKLIKQRIEKQAQRTKLLNEQLLELVEGNLSWNLTDKDYEDWCDTFEELILIIT